MTHAYTSTHWMYYLGSKCRFKWLDCRNDAICRDTALLILIISNSSKNLEKVTQCITHIGQLKADINICMNSIAFSIHHPIRLGDSFYT